MIEIQCTSCHTRYRIDERVLPAESPTFKCSRCGHVFTADPVAAKRVAAEAAASKQTSRAPGAKAEPQSKPISTASTAAPKVSLPASEPSASEEPAPAVSSSLSSEAKPAPIKPYIRNQRPTVFDRSPAPPAKSSPEPVDTAAVARMKASFEPPTPQAPKPEPPRASASAESRRASEPTTSTSEKSPTPESSRADDDGENLEFDFNDDSNPELGDEPHDDDASAAAERWSVGDDAVTPPPQRPSAFGRGEPDPGFSRGEPAPIGRGTIPQYAGSHPAQRSPLPDERAFIERAGLHSARSFIGLFFIVALIFVVLTVVIYAIPSASAELLRKMPVIGPEFVQTASLENRISISAVQSSYQTVKGGRQALVLTGTVKNNSDISLHTIQIGVRLLDASQQNLASSGVYCGTTLSPRMIGEMTPHELEFLQKLDPQKTFVLEPGHAAPFLMLFIDPPREVRHFAVAISKAEPTTTAQTSEASAHP